MTSDGAKRPATPLTAQGAAGAGPLTDGAAPLDVERIRRARAAARFGATLHYQETTASTNSDAQRLARGGAGEGTVVLAETQTQGRGRLGRGWTSPPFRNLYMSVVLRPQIAVSQTPQLALVAGAAATSTIRAWCPRASIKWPNDVLIDGRKVCGILAEMEAAHDLPAFVILGIGVNLNMRADDFPPALREKAVSLGDAIGTPIDRAAFTVALLSQLESFYDRFVTQGFAALRSQWESLCTSLGGQIQVDDGERRYSGIALGLGDDGSLRLQLSGGEEVRLVAGDVTVIDGYAARR